MEKMKTLTIGNAQFDIFDDEAVHFTLQELTNEQKKQARENIDAQPAGNYLTEHQDISGKLDANKLPEAVNAALAQAKESGEFDGADGKDGKTPSIGTNGNWFINELDTGKPSRGEPGYTPQLNIDYFNGQNGEDGFSVVVSVSDIDGGHRVTFTDIDGQKTIDVMDGENGNGIKSAVLNDDYTLTLTFDNDTSYTTPSIRGVEGRRGEKGDPITVEKVTESSTDGGVNVVEFSDGSKLNVRNGSVGSPGEPGFSPTVNISKSEKVTTIKITDKNGEKTATINDGSNGTSVTVSNVSESTASGGTNVVTFSDSKKVNIKNGNDGKTPVRGTDYWTEADQESIVQQVIAALGTPVFGTVDANNNIVLTGNLADGKYTLKYEDAEGNVTTIGTLTAEGAPTYTNMLTEAINSDGTPFVYKDRDGVTDTVGYKVDTRLGYSGSESTSSSTGLEVSGFIPVKYGDVLYFKNVEVIQEGTNSDKCYFTTYTSDFAKIADRRADSTGDQDAFIWDDNKCIKSVSLYNGGGWSSNVNNAAYLRFSATEINATSIVTKNEPID